MESQNKMMTRKNHIHIIDNEVRLNLIKDINLIKHPKAGSKAIKVALVEKGWYDAFIDYLTYSKVPPPGKIRTRKLYEGSRFNIKCKLHVDFEVIELKRWEILSKIFGYTSQIIRYYILHPATHDPVVILTPKKIDVQFKGRNIQKIVEGDWLLGPVKDQLCDALGVDSRSYSFYSASSSMPVPNNKTFNDISDGKNAFLILKTAPITDKILNKYSNYNINTPTTSGLPKPSDFQNKMKSNDNNSDEYEVSVSTPPCFHRPVASTRNNQKILKPKIDQKKNSITTTSPSSPLSSSRVPNSPLNQFSGTAQKVVKPIGLCNIGNTCFFNAAVQCLVRCQALTNFILSPQFEKQVNRNNPLGTKGKVAYAYRDLLDSMTKSESRYAINPSRLHRAIADAYPIFDDFGQNDSQELIGALLDALHEDLNQSSTAKGTNPPIEIPKNADSLEIHLAKNSSPILDIFHGSLLNCLECPSCYLETINKDPFVFLSLPIPQSYSYSSYNYISPTSLYSPSPISRKNVSLSDCMELFSKSEALDCHNLWKCIKCGKEVQAKKRIKIDKTSNILIIHLKRFDGQSYYMKKIETPVEYPDILNIGNSSHNDSKNRYKLIGVVFHHGSLIGGHYTAAAVDPKTEKWYYFNDSIVREITSGEAHSSQAYILFYQKI